MAYQVLTRSLEGGKVIWTVHSEYESLIEAMLIVEEFVHNTDIVVEKED